MRKPSASARRPGRSPAVVKDVPKRVARKGVSARATEANTRSNGSSARSAAARAVTAGQPRGVSRLSKKVPPAGKIAPVTDTQSGTSRGKYVYCIIEASETLRFGPVGIGAEPSEVY